MHLWLLIKDAWYAQSWWDKLRIWFMPLGWRPDDVARKYPVYKINDVYHFDKYDSHVTSDLLAWCWIQMIVLLILISYLFGNIATIGAPDMFIYGAFVFLMVYSYTELLDGNKYAWVWETVKNTLGIVILLTQQDWFGINQYFSGAATVLTIYFIIATAMSVWFSRSRTLNPFLSKGNPSQL